MSMKRFINVLCVLVLIASGSELIPFDKIESLANNFINQWFGSCQLDEVLTYCSLDEEPIAYALIYHNQNKEPVTIVMGARYTATPIGEITRGLPRSKSGFNRVLRKAQNLSNRGVQLQKLYYFGPGEEYVGFRIDDREILINTVNFRLLEKSLLIASKSGPNRELESLTRAKWEKYFNTTDFTIRARGYVDSVPFIDWVYGCTPTAASMLFWYWDSRGYGRLVDYFFTHWDYPEGEWNDCANTNRELAIAMNTDTISGGTMIGNVRPGMIAVANTLNGYSFTSATSPQGNTGNNFVFSWIKTEIDNQRPCHWNVLYYWYPPFNQYINHSITGVGYEIIPPDTFVRVHTTWDNNEPLWPLYTYYDYTYSYDYVVTLVPGGSNPNNILLDEPQGGDIYGMPIIFKNIKYYIRWHSLGAIDHVKLWHSKGTNNDSYDSLRWVLISGNQANTGKFVWTCPAIDCSLRINISGLDAANVRQGADGGFGRCQIREISHSAEINLVGHYDTPGWGNDIVISTNYAFIADGTNGLLIADISDSSLPDYYSHLNLPGNSSSLTLGGQYLYIGSREDTLRVISIANLSNPVQVGRCSLGDDILDVFVVDTLVYAAVRSQGLVIVNVKNPANPLIVGTYNTAGLANDVYVSGGYAYVADGTKGVRVIDISNPTNPVETGYYDTNGSTNGVIKSGNLVYAADGSMGIKIFDGSSPDTLLLLGSLDTPNVATKVQLSNNYLFVADGNLGGIRVINISNPSSPVEAGYISGSYGSAGNIWLNGRMVYLADGGTGLLLITQAFTGIEEENQAMINFSVEILPNPTVINKGFMLNLAVQNKGNIEVSLFDCSGRYLRTIYKGLLNPGKNQVHYQPKDMPSGIYFVKTEFGNCRSVQKLILIK